MSNLDYLLSPQVIRDSAKRVYEEAINGRSHFRVHEEQLNFTVDYVLATIRQNYPDLNIPFHSRWGHFRPAGVDRSRWLEAKLTGDALEKARVKLDLVIPSVLLDAGAGAAWKFHEQETDKDYNRSEGLGVASFHMFMKGSFCSDKKSLKTDSEGLINLTAFDIETGFQVSANNPLIGVEGRVRLLNNLGTVLESNKTIFKDGRPGNIIDYLIARYGTTIPATGVLRAVLDGLGPIWPGRLTQEGVNLGDIWNHSKLGMIAFHKLSQWMTYSLIEPIEEAGVKVTGVEGLTGLAEYRNGGLLLDTGLLTFKNANDAQKTWTPDSDLIIEWRALTVYFLDIIGAEVQKALGKSPADFPLAKVLEGGTWWAGRRIAAEKRAGGGPPLNIQSDGTVF